MNEEEFHQQVLAFEGVWKGQGRVINKKGGDDVPYKEEFIWTLLRQTPTMIVYQVLQKTKHAVVDDMPMHAETGFIKFVLEPTNSTVQVEAGFTHPFPKGLVTELAIGSFHDKTLHLDATKFQRPSDIITEKTVTKFSRSYTVDGDKLMYTMQLHDEPHLECELTKE